MTGGHSLITKLLGTVAGVMGASPWGAVSAYKLINKIAPLAKATSLGIKKSAKVAIDPKVVGTALATQPIRNESDNLTDQENAFSGLQP